MLRICHSDTTDGQHWRLCGRLAGPWVDELRACWLETRERAPLAHTVVDLEDVTFIDEGGERLLAEMEIGGAELIASGVANKHVVECLKNRTRRPLRRSLEDLSAGAGRNATTKGGDQ